MFMDGYILVRVKALLGVQHAKFHLARPVRESVVCAAATFFLRLCI